MTTPFSAALTDDHHRCDRLLALVERAMDGKDWGAVGHEAAQFREATESHFVFEEEVLFPVMEARLPMAAGPTKVMRMEHAQMRRMLEELSAAVMARSVDDCLGILETLHLVAQQHNAKEEAILYPMADRTLAGEAEGLLAQLGASQATASGA
jgi:hemerythrin-like domain-containing protein